MAQTVMGSPFLTTNSFLGTQLVTPASLLAVQNQQASLLNVPTQQAAAQSQDVTSAATNRIAELLRAAVAQSTRSTKSDLSVAGTRSGAQEADSLEHRFSAMEHRLDLLEQQFKELSGVESEAGLHAAEVQETLKSHDNRIRMLEDKSKK
jgi:hypothetical protein